MELYIDLKIRTFLTFSLNSALLSRCRVIPLNKLTPEAVRTILERALKAENVPIITTSSLGLNAGRSVCDEAIEFLSNVSDGDARTALNCLEIALSMHENSSKKCVF